MKRFSLLAAILIMMTALSTLAAPKPNNVTVQRFPGILSNHAMSTCFLRRRSVRYESTSRRSGGDQRRAGRHSEVGQTTLVYQSPSGHHHSGTSRPSEDVMAVIDGTKGPNGISLARHGPRRSASGEIPLVTQSKGIR